MPADKPMRVNQCPMISGHKGPLLDLKWCPHDDNLLGTCSEDNTIRCWKIPEDGLKNNLHDGDEMRKLSGHHKKVLQLDFHPSAFGLIASSSFDKTVKTWDLEKSKDIQTLEHTDG